MNDNNINKYNQEPEHQEQQPIVQSSKNNNSTAIIAVLLALGVIGVVVFSLLSDNDKVNNKPINKTTNNEAKEKVKEEKTKDTEEEPKVIEEEPVEPTEEPVEDSTERIVYNGYSFIIPEGLTASIDYEVLNYFDVNKMNILSIGIANAGYYTLRSRKNLLKEEIMGRNYNVSDPVIKTINGLEYITFTGSLNGTGFFIGYAKLDSGKTAVGSYWNITGDDAQDYPKLSKISDIIKSAKKVQ